MNIKVEKNALLTIEFKSAKAALGVKVKKSIDIYAA